MCVCMRFGLRLSRKFFVLVTSCCRFEAENKTDPKSVCKVSDSRMTRAVETARDVCANERALGSR